MSVAVVLALDLSISARIFGLVKALPDASVHQPGPIPHLVLASYDDTVDVSDLDAALASATNWKRLPITLVGVGVSPGDPTTIGVLSVPTIDLIQRHSTLHQALSDLRCEPAYKPGSWLPRVVLTETMLVSDTVEVLAAVWPGTITGWAASLDLLRLDPFEVLSSRPLRA